MAASRGWWDTFNLWECPEPLSFHYNLISPMKIKKLIYLLKSTLIALLAAFPLMLLLPNFASAMFQ